MGSFIYIAYRAGIISRRTPMDTLRGGSEHLWTYPERNDNDPDQKNIYKQKQNKISTLHFNF